MHCKPNPLESGKRSGQRLNSTRCRCDARHQHWNLWRDTNHNLHHSLIFMSEIGVNTHYDQICTHEHPKSDSCIYIFYTCMRNQCHFNLFVYFLSCSNTNSYLRFLSARLLLVEFPQCFLLGGPILVLTAPVTYDLDLLIGWLGLWLTLSGLTVTPVRSVKLFCKGVFPVREARIVTWVKNILHLIIPELPHKSIKDMLHSYGSDLCSWRKAL